MRKLLLFFIPFFGLLPQWGLGQSVSGFEENKGQFESDVFFRTRLPESAVYIQSTGMSYQCLPSGQFEEYHQFQHGERSELPRFKAHTLQLHFVNAKLQNPQKYHPAKSYKNVFRKGMSATRIQSFKEVQFSSIYPGVHLKFTRDWGFKYEFIVEPFANPAQIKLYWEGADALRIDEAGNWRAHTSVGELIEEKPFAYQINSRGKLDTVLCHFLLKGDSMHFQLGNYDSNRSLVIDPRLVFSTYSGSQDDNWGFTSTFDQSGNLYLGGVVFGSDFPLTPGAMDTVFQGAMEVAIMKFDSSGTNLLYSTFLGGSSAEQPHSLIAFGEELLIMGATGSANFPVSNTAFDTVFRGGTSTAGTAGIFPQGTDIFISKLSADGTQLLASTFVGGLGNDGLNSLFRNSYGDDSRGDILVNTAGEVFIASSSISADFPTNATSFGNCGSSQDAVVFKLSPDLSQVIWSYCLGGSLPDAAFSLALNDIETELYVCGATRGSGFPTTTGAFNENYLGGTADGFISRLDAANATLLSSTFIGGIGRDISFLLDLNPAGEVAIFGQSDQGMPISDSSLFHQTNARQFLQLYSQDLSVLSRSTLFGSGRNSYDLAPTAFRIDECGVLYLSGWGGSLASSGSRTFDLEVSSDAYQDTTDGADFYIMALNSEWKKLLYASFFGGIGTGEHVDGGTSRFSENGVISQAICAGCGGTSNTPAEPSNVWSTTNESSNCNMLAFRFAFELDTLTLKLTLQKDTVCLGQAVNFIVEQSNATSFYRTLGDGRTDSSIQSVSYPLPGEYTIHLTAFNDQCGTQISDSVKVQVVDVQQSYQLIAQYDTCDANRWVTFDIIPPLRFFEIHTSTGVVLDSLPAIYSYPGTGAYQPYLVAFDPFCNSVVYDTTEVYFSRGLPFLRYNSDYTACRDGVNYFFSTVQSSILKLTVDFGDGQQEIGRGNEWPHTYSEPGLYTITIEAEDSICNVILTESFEIQVGQLPFDERIFPNVFTPNGDNLNDFFNLDGVLLSSGVSQAEVQIFNRWGERVYSGEPSWDGSFSGNEVAEGVYFWVLSGKNTCGETFESQGVVHLMR